MDSSQLDRLKRIEQFEIDAPGVRLRFADRLARENGWTAQFARRVIAEYKRFCFLAMEAGHPVTPSEQIDQAWHLHLVYTRNYWEDFCPNALGQPLHHGPTKGGEAESHKHHDWYEKTRASYQRLFGEAPPTDIWPSAADRFHHDPACRRVNWKENWVVPKRPVRAGLKFAVAGVALMAVIGCAPDAPNPLDWKGEDFLFLYAGLGVAFMIWNVLVRLLLNFGPIPADTNPALTDYEIAYLQNKEEGIFLTATVKLTQRGHLALNDSGQLILGTRLPENAHPIEREVVAAYTRHTDPAKAQKSCQLSLEEMNQQLLEAGLLIAPAKASAIRLMTTIPFVLLFFFGLTKIMVGVQRDKSVAFLIIMSVVCLVTSLVVMATAPRLSGFGKRHLGVLRSRHYAMRTDKARFSPTYDEIGLPVALFGTMVLIGSPYDQLGKTLQPVSSSTSDGSSSSSGCSGGGDGGGSGCGGCGGCGGGGD
ncbi:TIGR04222 domain-containing membrane protein [Zavarzinella formosa]|uniref:TIGR04222 domain-containing membrane protein n=1 Tax=Zavarzinella formosa TaxID=360055 RepID=UPI000496AEBD|nr:TIGR04222 domain-containing membrane protein [Zavarzinella formosa]